MPGNREAYSEAMNAGHEAAWNQDWAAAAEAYSQALQEFPNDEEAHLNLAFVLLQADRLDEALRVYKKAHQLSPNDPIALEKSAEVLEKMGRLREAAQQYANVAELYLKQKDLDKAVANWERATYLTPGLVALHSRLAQAYRRLNDRPRALYQYLLLAFNLQRSGDISRAKQATIQALKLNNKNVEALNTLRALESGGEVVMPTPPQDKLEPNKKVQNLLSEVAIDSAPAAKNSDADPLGPLGDAMNTSLNLLASHVMESGGFDSGGIEAMQAMEMQRQGLQSEAIGAYQRAAVEMQHPALLLNLGALLLLSDQPAEAVDPLTGAASDNQLEAGALQALGQAYFNMAKFRQSTTHLLKAAKSVESNTASSMEDFDSINEVYDPVVAYLPQRNEDDPQLESVSERLISLMRGNTWESRITNNRYQMLQALREGGPQRVIETLAEKSGGALPEAVSLIDRYIRQGLFTLAMDEAHYAIEQAPTYLPVHVRMAEIMMNEGRVRQAITKYNTVARTYLTRGENGRAASILSEVLEQAPLDVSVRLNLLNLLESEERWEEALEQYTELAGTYHQLSNLEKARQTYDVAEKMADRVGAPVEQVVRIKHAIADIDKLKMDIRKAQRVYGEIVELNPEDEKARKELVDINLSTGNKVEGFKHLDELLRIYAKRKEVKAILKLLESLVGVYSDDAVLRSRLAQMYGRLDRRADAVEQWDKVADLQLEQGLNQDACNSIKQIIKLKPNNIEDYQKLLGQLGC